MSQDIHQNHYILGIYQVFFLASLPGNPENDGPAAISMTRYYCYYYYYYYYYVEMTWWMRAGVPRGDNLEEISEASTFDVDKVFIVFPP